ncbi:MAG: DAK2 domain-containing protein, partial [Nitrolancea sp.]
AERALAQTPDMLPILRQAGVVDAGGKGLVVILDGLLRFAHGDDPATASSRPSSDVASSMNFLDQVELVHGVDEFGYCTNFLLTGDDLDVQRFREIIDNLGSSAVVVGTDRALKVHVHSEHPGALLEAALTFGELEDVRIDNMAAQTRRLMADRSTRAQQSPMEMASVPIAVVAVATGNGLTTALTGMGANRIVDGGATNNPSTEEILRAVEDAPSDTVIVLPNDPNVISAARQVGQLTEKSVRVVPSKSVPQGIAALSAFNLALNVDENAEAMTDALELVDTVTVTRASRDALIDGVSARQGDYIGLLDGRMVSAGETLSEVALAALEESNAKDAELLTLFTGVNAGETAIEGLIEAINGTYPDLTIEVVAGDQPHHDVIMAVE